MAEVFESVTVTIRKNRYDELLRKEAAHDAYARKLKADKERGGFVCENEWALFVEDVPRVNTFELLRDFAATIPEEEKNKAFFSNEEPVEEISEEVWDEIEAMVESPDDFEKKLP